VLPSSRIKHQHLRVALSVLKSAQQTSLRRAASLGRIDLNDYDHVENLTYTGRSTSTLIGSDLANVIFGGAGTALGITDSF
jgi:hypothetical protein